MPRKVATKAGEILIRSFEEADRTAFVSLYQQVFAEPPWNETWTREAVDKEISEYFGQRSLHFVLAFLAPNNGQDSNNRHTGELVGFSVAYELNLEHFSFLSGVFESGEAINGDELGVRSDLRGKGIATALIIARMEDMSEAGYSYLVGRTHVESKMVPLYIKLEFKNTGIQDSTYPNRFYFVRELRRR